MTCHLNKMCETAGLKKILFDIIQWYSFYATPFELCTFDKWICLCCNLRKCFSKGILQICISMTSTTYKWVTNITIYSSEITSEAEELCTKPHEERRASVSSEADCSPCHAPASSEQVTSYHDCKSSNSHSHALQSIIGYVKSFGCKGTFPVTKHSHTDGLCKLVWAIVCSRQNA